MDYIELFLSSRRKTFDRFNELQTNHLNNISRNGQYLISRGCAACNILLNDRDLLAYITFDNEQHVIDQMRDICTLIINNSNKFMGVVITYPFENNGSGLASYCFAKYQNTCLYLRSYYQNGKFNYHSDIEQRNNKNLGIIFDDLVLTIENI